MTCKVMCFIVVNLFTVKSFIQNIALLLNMDTDYDALSFFSWLIFKE